jgi:2-C-methyl-D-erythritol 4-phosphate cytidylyltransferase
MTKKISAILLAGGKSTRMQNSTPKQFLLLKNKPIILYSFELFDSLPEITEIIVVCENIYIPLFPKASKPLKFALPGARRQDSVFSGFSQAANDADYLCIHDGARPLIDKESILSVLHAAEKHDAAALALPVTYTIKECTLDQKVIKTLPRNQLWEMHTPQVLTRNLVKKGFEKVQKENLEITDDIQLAEILEKPAYLVRSASKNIKITTPLDLSLAEIL